MAANPQGESSIDGLPEITDLKAIAETEKVVTEFVTNLEELMK